jgi:hypothetical protein
MELVDSKKIPINLLLECQRLSYRLFEDLRQLQNHPFVKTSSSEVDTFISNVNRRVLIEDDPGEREGIRRKELICEFVFDHSGDFRPLIDKANSILEIFENYIPSSPRVRMPPPVWLRLLPLCLEMTYSLGLWGEQARTKLRFISFALEPLNSNNSDPYEPFVNINSDAPRLEITGWNLGEGLVSHSLNRALFGSYYNKRLENIGRHLPYVWWGIRFRTADGGPNPQVVPVHRNCLDVYIDQQQFKGQLDSENKKIIPVSAKVAFPKPLPKEVKSGLENLFRDWAFEEYNDVEKRKFLPLDTPSKQLFAYVRLNQRSFPHKKLPDNGMDCLICPGVFWSANPLLWGTGMTIVYGFEGYLEEQLSDLLLSLTQQLMIGPTVYAQVNKIWVSAERSGRHNLLHELPGYMDSIGITVRGYDEKRRAFLEKYPQIPPDEVPPIPRTDDVDVMVMLLAAENKELRELPSDLAEGLRKEWTLDFLNEFVERVVWTPVLGDVTSNKKVIENMGKGVFSAKDLVSGNGAFEQPKLVLSSKVNPRLTQGLFPLFLLTLKSAFYHAFLHSIMNSHIGQRGLVTIGYRDEAEAQYIEIKNSGDPPGGTPAPQHGWHRNTELFKDMTDWTVEMTKMNEQIFECSTFWLTTLRRKPE